MARRITIKDDQAGAELCVTIEDPQSTEPRITGFSFAVPEGSAVKAEHLEMLQEFGLRLPAPRAKPAPVKRTPRPKLPAKRTPADEPPPPDPGGDGGSSTGTPSPPDAGRRPYRRRPGNEAVLAAFTELKGSPDALAARYDVPKHTATSWVARARQAGLLPKQRRQKPPTKKGKAK